MPHIKTIHAYSKWLEVHVIKSTTSTATIEKLREIFAMHGLPKTVVSDNGTNFSSNEFELFMSQNGIKHIKVSPYNPASNGPAERAVRIFKKEIVKMEGGSLKTKLARFLLSYRITPHSSTGVLPAELLMNRQLHTQLNQLCPNLHDRVLGKQTRQKLTHDYHAKHREIKVDDSVYVKDFRRPKSCISGTVVEKTGPVSAKVQLSTGEVIRRHQDQIRIRNDPVPTLPTGNGSQDTPPPLEIPLIPSDISPTAASQTSVLSSPTPSVPPQPATIEESPQANV